MMNGYYDDEYHYSNTVIEEPYVDWDFHQTD